MTRAEKKIAAQIDAQISAAFQRQCRGIQVGIWTLPEIFAAGRKALAEGRDLDIAIREATEIAARGLR